MTETDIYREIIRVQESGEEVALITIISTSGSTPREEGSKMLLKDDGSIVGTIAVSYTHLTLPTN